MELICTCVFQYINFINPTYVRKMMVELSEFQSYNKITINKRVLR